MATGKSKTGKSVRVASGPAKAMTLGSRLEIGDCLPVLVEMQKKHGEFADLVYLDPPFNSARLYNYAFKGVKRTLPQQFAFADTWKWTEATKKACRYFTETEASGTSAGEFLAAMRTTLEKRDGATLAYLTYMTRRLARIRAVMKPTASIFLHCDQTAAHYLKLAMDAVFGRENFRNDLIWGYTGAANVAKHFPRKHDNLLFYGKSAATVFNKEVEAVRVPYSDSSVARLNQDYTKNWWSKNAAKKAAREKRRAELVKKGKLVEDYWIDIPRIAGGESMGYQTQKPVALLRRIVAASSNPGDLVLDPFCGCGTTIAACHELGRRFIGIDVARVAAEVIEGRMQRDYPGFGKLEIGDETPTDSMGWGRLLPDEDADGDFPAWARFQYKAIAAIPKAVQHNEFKQGADGGVDGLIHLERPRTKARVSIVIQVKRHKTPSMADVADTALAVQNNDAFMGLLITLNPPSPGMVERGASRQKRFNGGTYPNVAILTYEQVKAGEFEKVLPYQYAVDAQEGSQKRLGLSTDHA